MAAEERAVCRSVDAEFDCLADPGAPLSAAARQHMATCARCRLLYGHADAPPATPAVSMAAVEATRRTLLTELSPVRPIRSAAATTALLGLVFVSLAIPLIAMSRIGGFRVMRWWQMLPMSALFAVCAILLCLSVSWQMAPGRLQRISGKSLRTVLAVAFVAGAVVLFPWQLQGEFVRSGARCLLEGSAMALPAMALFVLLLRRGAPPEPGMLGSTMGTLAGLLGVTVLQFTCPLQQTLHLALWHGGILLVAALAGAAIGPYSTRAGAMRP